MSKRQYSFIFYIKALAALLILNSHYDSIYPIESLATGGAIGNALFFASSGFLLEPVKDSFNNWFFPKWIKVYIPALFVTIICLATYQKSAISDYSVFYVFIWPTLFWFVGAIILFYILFYLLRKVSKDKDFVIAGIILTVIYVIYYIFFMDKNVWSIEAKGLYSTAGYFKLIYYFAAMLLGKYARINFDLFSEKSKLSNYIILCIGSFISIYGIKYVLLRQPSLMALQFLNQISVLFLVYAVFCIGIKLEEKAYNGKLLRISQEISRITLYLYLTQFIVIEYFHKLAFPINFFLCTTIIFMFSLILERVFSYILIKLLKR